MTDEAGVASLVELEETTSAGAGSVAAAKLGFRVVNLLNRSLAAAGLSQNDLAVLLEISPARVSQVLGGEGNLRISTVARFLRAAGYELELTARSIHPDGKDLTVTRRRAKKKAAEEAVTDHWHQAFASTGGVSVHKMRTVRGQHEGVPTPLGGPMHVGSSIDNAAPVAYETKVFLTSRGGLDAQSWARMTRLASAVENVVPDRTHTDA